MIASNSGLNQQAITSGYDYVSLGWCFANEQNWQAKRSHMFIWNARFSHKWHCYHNVCIFARPKTVLWCIRYWEWQSEIMPSEGTPFTAVLQDRHAFPDQDHRLWAVGGRVWEELFQTVLCEWGGGQTAHQVDVSREPQWRTLLREKWRGMYVDNSLLWVKCK